MEKHRRIPRVRDLQYLFAYLKGLQLGGEAKARELLRHRRLEFEKEKAEAMGGGKMIDIEKVHINYLLQECQKMGIQLGLIKKCDGKLTLNEEDPSTKAFLAGDLKNKLNRSVILEKFFLSYESFRHLIFKIRERPYGKIYATIDRGKRFFEHSVKNYGIEIGQWDFEMIRDLGSQLGILNWRLLNEQETRSLNLGKRGISLYLTSYVINLSDLFRINQFKDFKFYFDCLNMFVDNLGIVNKIEIMSKNDITNIALNQNFLAIPLEGDVIFIKEFEPSKKMFEEKLWKRYIELADYTAGTPVMYVELRDIVCEDLMINDMVFDNFIIDMINNPNTYDLKVYPAEGVLPRFLSDKRKNIPPRVRYGVFAVYLIIYRKKGGSYEV